MVEFNSKVLCGYVFWPLAVRWVPTQRRFLQYFTVIFELLLSPIRFIPICPVTCAAGPSNVVQAGQVKNRNVKRDIYDLVRIRGQLMQMATGRMGRH